MVASSSSSCNLLGFDIPKNRRRSACGSKEYKKHDIKHYLIVKNGFGLVSVSKSRDSPLFGNYDDIIELIDQVG